MPHTYATVPAFHKYRVDGGSTETANDSTILPILEAASRAVDNFCNRSMFGSGFGPRTGTNRYNGQGGHTVDFADDLLSLTSISLLDSTAGSSLGSVVADTDYYLTDEGGRFEPAPYRKFLLHGQGSVTRLGIGHRVSSFTGTWGYENRTRTATATAGAIASTTATTFVIGGTDDLEVGMTLLIDSEQVYLRAKSGTTATIDRGVNGTTAATHSGGAAIAFYLYTPAVVDATLRIAHRRWKMRDAGLVANFGGGTMPDSAHQDSEWSILRSTVNHLRLYSAA